MKENGISMCVVRAKADMRIVICAGESASIFVVSTVSSVFQANYTSGVVAIVGS